MEDEKAKKLIPRIERAIDLIESSEIEEGLSILKLCEDRLNILPDSEPDLKMIVFHNLALCYQLTEDYSECAKYIKLAIRSSKSRKIQDSEQVRNLRYTSMLYIQQGAIFSHLGDHVYSVRCAKKAFSFISKAFQLCLSSQTKLPEQLSASQTTLETCLSFLSGDISKFPLSSSKLIQRTSLGVQHFTDWVYSFTVNDLLDIKPLKYFEVKNSETFISEFSKDLMLQKVCLLVTSCYLTATESRLLDDQAEVNKAKNWHFRAVEIGSALLPLETPLLQHIKISFDKHYQTLKKSKVLKSKTPVKKMVCKSKTPVRSKDGLKKVKVEIKTDRNYSKKKTGKAEKADDQKTRTQRDNRETEQPVSEDHDESPTSSTFIINSEDLYGICAED